jgi:hypothetical protein
VPDSFPEIFRRKTSRKLKKPTKKQFSRGIGKQKSAKPKNLEKTKKQKKTKKQYSRSLGEGGSD